MSGLELHWHGGADFDRAMRAMTARVDRANREAVVEAGKELVRLTEAEAPRKRGTLAGSVEATPVSGPQSASSVKVGPTVVYGRRVELGFKGGRKSAKGVTKFRKTLREAGYSKAVIARAEATRNRGLSPTRPDPFLARAHDQFIAIFGRLTLSQWAKAMKK